VIEEEEDQKVTGENLVLLGEKVKWERRVKLANEVHKDQLDLKANRDHWDRWDRKEMMGRKASPAWKVRLDQKVPKDKLVRKETLDLLGHPDLPVHLESCLCCLLNCFSKETVQLAARNATRKAQKIYRMTAILEPLVVRLKMEPRKI